MKVNKWLLASIALLSFLIGTAFEIVGEYPVYNKFTYWDVLTVTIFMLGIYFFGYNTAKHNRK